MDDRPLLDKMHLDGLLAFLSEIDPKTEGASYEAAWLVVWNRILRSFRLSPSHFVLKRRLVSVVNACFHTPWIFFSRISRMSCLFVEAYDWKSFLPRGDTHVCVLYRCPDFAHANKRKMGGTDGV